MKVALLLDLSLDQLGRILRTVSGFAASGGGTKATATAVLARLGDRVNQVHGPSC